VSIIDDLKELLSLNAHELQQRAHAIEDKLDAVARSSDYAAKVLDFEIVTQRYTFTGTSAKPSALFTAPQGTYYEALHWAWKASASVRPGLFLNDANQLIDTTELNEQSRSKYGRQEGRNWIVPPGQTLLAADIQEGPGEEMTLTIQFKVYTLQPSYLADVVASE
jgi:hypothetical protein